MIMENSEYAEIVKLPHHEHKGPCTTRSYYRQGKKLTAVKVYTVNNESQHLIVRGVPSLNLLNELNRACSRYGEVIHLSLVTNYSETEEPFTNVYHVSFSRIQSARFAKHMLDNKSFFGGTLYVCYAPELETLSQTRYKLQTRRREVAIRINKMKMASEKTLLGSDKSENSMEFTSNNFTSEFQDDDLQKHDNPNITIKSDHKFKRRSKIGPQFNKLNSQPLNRNISKRSSDNIVSKSQNFTEKRFKR